MKDFNTLTVTGRLGQDVDVRTTADGKTIASFSIAVNGYKDGDTMWLRVNAWEKTGEVCANFLQKGSRVLISGPLSIRPWQDKDGNTKYSTEVTAREVVFLGGKGDSGSSAPQKSAPAGNQGGTNSTPSDAPEEDVPF